MTESIQAIKVKAVSGAVSYFLRTIILQVIGLIAQLVLSAYLTSGEFGVFGVITQIIGILVFFSDIGLASSLIQQKEEPTELQYRIAFTAQQFLAWLIFIIVVLIAWSGVFSESLGKAGTWVMLALGLSFPLASLKTVPSLLLERQLNFNLLVIPQIVEQLFFNLALVLLSIGGWGLWAYFPAVLLRSVSGVLVMYFLKPWTPHFAWNWLELKGLLRYGARFQLNDFLARIKDQLYFLVIGVYWLPSTEQFGYVSWAKNWSMYPYILTVQNVMAVTFPTFSRLRGDLALLQRAIEKSLYFITLSIVPLLVAITVFAPPLTVLIPRYIKWQPALFSLALFSLSIVWGAISTPLTNTLNAVGKVGVTTKLMLIWTVLTWVLTPPLVWMFGYHGVALASFLISFSSVLSVWEVQKIVKVRVWDNVWVAILSGFATLVLGIFFQDFIANGWWQFLSGFILLISVYLLLVWYFDRAKLVLELKSLFSKSQKAKN